MTQWVALILHIGIIAHSIYRGARPGDRRLNYWVLWLLFGLVGGLFYLDVLVINCECFGSHALSSTRVTIQTALVFWILTDKNWRTRKARGHIS